MNAERLEKMQSKKGFVAALDQSGGSTPKALALYGIPQDSYNGEQEMFDLVHQMRTRIITNPSFTGDKILGAIIFTETMRRTIDGIPTADYLWEKKGIVPFLKIDKGLAKEENGVRLMKDIPDLDSLLDEAVRKNIFGTKERSVILASDRKGISDLVDQQFEIAKKVISYGLVPIIEPEVDIHIADKKEAEEILKSELIRHIKKLTSNDMVIFKLSLPSIPDYYEELASFPCTIRIMALSGGYSQKEANEILSKNHGTIASFSRAFSEGLSANMSDEEFTKKLATTVDSIYKASLL